ncbi:hypothetical protein GCM10017782_28860 [Deinococcus ficus]|nr:hypothetical protein GCM10017782_28860 [Deinococcus ficus]
MEGPEWQGHERQVDRSAGRPGVIDKDARRGAWNLHNITNLVEERFRKLQGARLFPSDPGKMSMAASRPLSRPPVGLPRGPSARTVHGFRIGPSQRSAGQVGEEDGGCGSSPTLRSSQRRLSRTA